MTDTDPTPERRWTLSESEYARPYAVFRSPTGGHLSSAYEPDVEAILATLNEAETLRAERDRLKEALAATPSVLEWMEQNVALRERMRLAEAVIEAMEQSHIVVGIRAGKSEIQRRWLAWRALAGAEPTATKEATMVHASKELGPRFEFSTGRNVVWFGHMWSGRRLTVWLKWGAFSIGRRFPKDDGWPERAGAETEAGR